MKKLTIEEVKQRFIEKKNILYYLQNILEVNKNYNIFVIAVIFQ
jgi:hypothetical protein